MAIKEENEPRENLPVYIRHMHTGSGNSQTGGATPSSIVGVMKYNDVDSIDENFNTRALSLNVDIGHVVFDR